MRVRQSHTVCARDLANYGRKIVIQIFKVYVKHGAHFSSVASQNPVVLAIPSLGRGTGRGPQI